MVRIRRAAAVLLTRGQVPQPEVFLIKRSPSMRFFGGYWALPGGLVDRLLDGEQPASSASTDKSTAEVEALHSRCAHRELFEETGVLVGPRAESVGSEERRSLRLDLVKRGAEHIDSRWKELCQRIGFGTGQIPLFAQLLTPPFAPLRYDTSFHHVDLPRGEQPDVDGKEAVDGGFFAAQEVLQRWTAGEIFVVPPTLHLLRLLVEKPDQDGLAEALESMGASCREIDRGRLYGACQSPGILAAPLLTPTIPPATTTNTYLVGGERVYVIDPATPDEAERTRLVAWCDEVVSEGRQLAGVLLTHHHEDHIGSAQALAQRYGIPVGAHPETHLRLELDGVERWDVQDGDRFELGSAPDGSSDWHLRALFTPGHAPGHLAFIESYLRGAIVGDMVSTLSTIVIDPPEGHMATYLASLQRLIDADIRVLHPAHGLPVRGGVEVVRQLLRHRAQREQRLLDALSPQPQAIASLLDVVYDDVTEEIKPLAQRSLLAGLQKLVEDDLAIESPAGWALGSE